MEFVPGEDLRSSIRRFGQLPIGKSISIAKQICEGLSEAHRLGVVHRDLKSNNIMIDKEGNARIMDFGIARSLEAKGITGAGVMIGTPEYMSPEQVEGKEVDQRSDVYSLGIILYEMLTGRVPFEGDTPFTIGMKHKGETPQNPKEFNSQISDDLNSVILRCLEKEKEKRFQSAGEVRSELENIEKGIPTTERAAPAKKTTTSKEVTVTFQRRWVWVAVLLMIVVASVVTFFLLKGGKSVMPKGKVSLVVLPFENLGPPEDDYFSNGISGEITDRLSYLSELDVISHNSALQFKRADKTIGQIREEFGVDYVVTGRVLWDKSAGRNGQVIVSPQLIDAAKDTQIWTDKIERPFENIAVVQARIAEQVARALDLTLLEPVREAIKAQATKNMEAYDFYLQAREQFNIAWSRLEYQEFEKIIELLEKAIDLDPDYVTPWLWLSLAHSMIYYYGIDRSEERLNESKFAIEKAQEIKPELPDANHILAYYYYWGFLDTERAEELYESARKVRPNVSLRLIADIYASQGKFEEAVEALKEETKRDPLNDTPFGNLASRFTNMRRYAEAEIQFDHAESLSRGFTSSYLNRIINTIMWKGYNEEAKTALNMIPEGELRDGIQIVFEATYGRNYEEVIQRLNSLKYESYELVNSYFNKDLAYALLYSRLGNSSLKESHAESARQTIENLIEKSPEDPRYHSSLGMVYALLGRKEDAVREGKKAVELYPISKDAKLGPAYILDLAIIHIINKEYEQAIAHLEHLMSIPAGKEVSITSLQSRPQYDPLRDHPRFKKLLEKYSEK
jgi:TolB-like protein/cytochrome c-type biogenesis protein CcmH/NrfG